MKLPRIARSAAALALVVSGLTGLTGVMGVSPAHAEPPCVLSGTFGSSYAAPYAGGWVPPEGVSQHLRRASFVLVSSFVGTPDVELTDDRWLTPLSGFTTRNANNIVQRIPAYRIPPELGLDGELVVTYNVTSVTCVDGWASAMSGTDSLGQPWQLVHTDSLV